MKLSTALRRAAKASWRNVIGDAAWLALLLLAELAEGEGR